MSILARELSFGYAAGESVLDDVSFEIKPAEKVALMGEFGAGKSTLLRIISGIYPDFKGSLQINGLPVGDYNGASLRSQVGIFLQHQPDIFEGSLYDNICLGYKDISGKFLDDLGALVGLLPTIEALPGGYNMPLKAAGAGLSGRMLRKILLMRALVHKPRLLLLEEPWLGLEPQYAQRIQEYLLRELTGTTAIIVTTEAGFAVHCDRTFQLQSGKLIIQ